MSALLRMGTHVVMRDLARDALGTVSRGVALAGDHVSHHVLIRTYDAALSGMRLEVHREALARRIGRLAGSRGLGSAHELLPAPHLGFIQACVPGRSLTQVWARAVEEELPFGLEQALSLAVGVCQALSHAHVRGLGRALLGPDSVWVGFDGSVHLLDACLSGELEGGIPGAPALAERLGDWLNPAAWAPGRRDDQVLARLLVQMLTGRPMGDCPPSDVLRELEAPGTSAEGLPFPASLTTILPRLMGSEPYRDLGEACRDLEHVLYDGEHGPTTFTLAFYLHQLFRLETFQDAVEEKEERGMVFAKTALAAPEGLVEPLPPGRSARGKKLLGAGVLAGLALVGGGAAYLRRGREHLAQQEARLKEERGQQTRRLEDLARAEQELTARMRDLEQRAREASDLEERSRAERDLLESQRTQADLVRQRERLGKPMSVPALPVASIREAPTPSVSAPQATPVAPVAVEDSEARLLVRGAVASSLWAQVRQVAPQARQVRVRVFVDRTGRGLKALVDQPQILPASLEEGFREAALQSRFAAALRQGVPTPGWVMVEFPVG